MSNRLISITNIITTLSENLIKFRLQNSTKEIESLVTHCLVLENSLQNLLYLTPDKTPDSRQERKLFRGFS